MNNEALAALLFNHVTITPQELEEKYPPRQLPEGAVVTRMAPSPTGYVHLGNLVQGLTSDRLARQSGGVLFLRIEDTDQKREVEGAVESLILGLSHYGIGFNEGACADGEAGEYGPYRQRQRKDIYHVYARELVLKGLAYPCFCTEEELAAFHAEQEAQKANFGYFGKWAKWRDADIESVKAELSKGQPWVLRFRSEGSIENKIKFTDGIKGDLEVTENDIDHVLLKSDGIPTYHFAHAVDDHLMRTTHVVRGDEWLSTLPFHLQLFRALGFKAPKYLHIGPLMKMDGTSKRKLSKRKDPELGLSFYRTAGFPVASVLEYLMTVLNSNFEDWRRANPNADIWDFKFTSKKMNPAGSLFDYSKLIDVSKTIVSRMTADEVYSLASDWAAECDEAFHALLTRDADYSKAILSIGRGGAKPRKDIAIWSELKDYMDFFFDELFNPQYPTVENVSKEDTLQILEKYSDIYDSNDDQAVWFDKIKALAVSLGYAGETKEYKNNPESYKGHVGDISAVLRSAVTGKANSPDMCTVMSILGADRVRARLKLMKASLLQ